MAKRRSLLPPPAVELTPQDVAELRAISAFINHDVPSLNAAPRASPEL